MIGLVDFLLLRIAADEVSALAGECRCEPLGTRPDCPERILADVEAKRAMVSLHRWAEDDAAGGVDAGEMADMGWDVSYDTLRALARPYSDHRDYLREWSLDWGR